MDLHLLRIYKQGKLIAAQPRFGLNHTTNRIVRIHARHHHTLYQPTFELHCHFDFHRYTIAERKKGCKGNFHRSDSAAAS